MPSLSLDAPQPCSARHHPPPRASWGPRAVTRDTLRGRNRSRFPAPSPALVLNVVADRVRCAVHRDIECEAEGSTPAEEELPGVERSHARRETRPARRRRRGGYAGRDCTSAAFLNSMAAILACTFVPLIYILR